MRLIIVPRALLIILLIVIIAGCSKAELQQDVTPKKLSELYRGDLQKVNHIEIRSGSTGELKTYSDQSRIQEWITQVDKLSLVPDSNQEGRTGYIYMVSLFEDKELKLSFMNTEISGTYYNHNSELVSAIEQLFEHE